MKDGDLIIKAQILLDDLCSIFDTPQWRDKYLFQVQSLREELDSPCVLAVAGKVKAGKSFLINALLGVDLAMTGNTETTATINVFKKITSYSTYLLALLVSPDSSSSKRSSATRRS